MNQLSPVLPTPGIIHIHLNSFTNHDELQEKLAAAVEKNRLRLFKSDAEQVAGLQPVAA
jgi:hypothetical protein